MLLLVAFLAIVAEGILLNYLRKSSKNKEIVKALIFTILFIAVIISVKVDDDERLDALKNSIAVPWIACGLLLALIFLDMSMPNNPVSVVFRAWNKTTFNLFFVMLILTIIAYSVTNWTK